MRLLTTLAVLAIVLAFCVPAFAETQNVKVSGDIALWTLARRGITTTNSLDKNADQTNSWDTDTVFMQQVGVNVAADLTDNVSTFVRVLNERDWDDPTNATLDIDLDEAYVTLKEMLYAPLTVKLGRQNLWFGKGFIVGNNSASWDANAALTADQISDATAFDAIRGTLDYDPWTIDLVLAKIDENDAIQSDDVDLYGINVGYVFDKYNAEAEAYLWARYDRNDRNNTLQGTNSIFCPGIRGSFVPFENMSLFGEAAYQDGQYRNAPTATSHEAARDRVAWALDLGGDYTFTNVKWTPMLGLEYIFYQGQEAERTGSDWTGWDTLYRGKFDSQIREYLDVLYFTAFSGGAGPTARRINGGTNQHQVVVRGAFNPMEDVKVDGNLNFFWLDENLDITKNSELRTGADSDTEIGTELDGKLTYNYTEDVTFQITGGVFWPGKAYPSDQDDTAAQAAARCAVEF